MKLLTGVMPKKFDFDLQLYKHLHCLHMLWLKFTFGLELFNLVSFLFLFLSDSLSKTYTKKIKINVVWKIFNKLQIWTTTYTNKENATLVEFNGASGFWQATR